ncbi:MAG: uracil-DNA glycosylase [Clostridia bacterium]|nr:uracil-DNA glycosylase [Clostridia bacterium]
MEKIRKECETCTLCPLHLSRTNVVFGRGNERAKLLFVGEAPGAKEDLAGKPFVGASGKLLEATLREVGIGEDEYYIANILKCRPPENRDPRPEEVFACTPYLERQIAKMRPSLVVCLGRIAAAHLIKKDFRITAEHGEVFEKDGQKILAVFHPAAILRDVRKKGEFLADFEKIRQILAEEK